MRDEYFKVTNAVEFLIITGFRRASTMRGCTWIGGSVQTMSAPETGSAIVSLLFFEGDAGLGAEFAVIAEFNAITGAMRRTLVAAEHFRVSRQQERLRGG